jgi:hypothetical protein
MKYEANVTANGITYSPTRADVQMIAYALEIIAPDTHTASRRAITLQNKFRILADSKPETQNHSADVA